MVDISNRTLALLLVTAIVVSLGFTMFSLNKIDQASITGRALTQPGNVTLNIQDATSIYLYKSLVDFGAGYVNTTKATCATNATLNASYRYIDSNDNDCWVGTTEPPRPTGLALENDGNRNVTITIKGPTPAGFFQGQGAPIANISWKSRNNETGSCVSGLQATFISFDSTAQSACGRLLFTPSISDDLAIDIQVIIPAGLPVGGYSNSTIELTAAAVG